MGVSAREEVWEGFRMVIGIPFPFAWRGWEVAVVVVVVVVL